MDITKLMEIMAVEPTPYLFSFLLACALSLFPGNLLVRWLHVRLLRWERPWPFGKKKESIQEIIGERPEHDTIGAMIMGRTERPLYIFAIMFAQSGVITAVIILKAFFNWTQVFTEPSLSSDQLASPPAEATAIERMRKTIAHYHAYVIGNLISLALALLLAELGIYLFLPLFKGSFPCL